MIDARTVLLAVTLAVARNTPVRAQHDVSVGATAGGTYYCIVSRCDTGMSYGVAAAVGIAPIVAVTVEAKRHACTDCDQFIMAGAALRLRAPAGRIRPFASAGVSYAHDPGFFGSRTGLLGSAGVAVVLNRRWSGELQLSGRRVGRGDALGELSVSVLHHFPF